MGHRDGPASSMRGRLSDVILGAICGGEAEAVVRRLGDRAVLDEPVFGASRGDAAVRAHVAKLVDWMSERAARFEKSHSLIGTASDAAEGTLFFGPQGARQSSPAAVIVERKKEREVEVRMHFVPMLSKSIGPTVPTETMELTGLVADAIAALSGRPHEPCFEERVRVCDGRGKDMSLPERKPVELVPVSVADDTRLAAVEVRSAGRGGLVVLERGESGLVRFVRIYGEI